MTNELALKYKGTLFINRFLKAKDLPPVAKNPVQEIRKALDLVALKLDKAPPFDYEEKGKIHRLLTNRGFDAETIQIAIDKTAQ